MTDERETRARDAMHLDQARPDFQESQTGEAREPGAPDPAVGHSDVPDPEARAGGTEERHGRALAEEHGHAMTTHEAAEHDADADHGDADASHAGGHGDEERLGPIDWNAWGASALGLAAGLAVAILFAMTAAR